jgi:membrane carboxypeptidase/penicillin-binding protein
MKDALSEISPSTPFHVPDGIVTAVIDPITGLLATNETEKMVEFFKEGTVPTEYSTEFYRELVIKQKEELEKIKISEPS